MPFLSMDSRSLKVLQSTAPQAKPSPFK